MAVSKEPIYKKCRSLGISPMVMGATKDYTKRNPDANKRRKVSEYGLQLKEKQKLRLDNVVFRMGLASTRREARQLVVHGHYDVNGKRVDIPSYRVKVGDVISLRENSKKSEKFKQIAETTAGRLTPSWLDVNKDAQSAKVVRMPVKDDLDYELEEHLIVELYSK